MAPRKAASIPSPRSLLESRHPRPGVLRRRARRHALQGLQPALPGPVDRLQEPFRLLHPVAAARHGDGQEPELVGARGAPLQLQVLRLDDRRRPLDLLPLPAGLPQAAQQRLGFRQQLRRRQPGRLLLQQDEPGTQVGGDGAEAGGAVAQGGQGLAQGPLVDVPQRGRLEAVREMAQRFQVAADRPGGLPIGEEAGRRVHEPVELVAPGHEADRLPRLGHGEHPPEIPPRVQGFQLLDQRQGLRFPPRGLREPLLPAQRGVQGEGQQPDHLRVLAAVLQAGLLDPVHQGAHLVERVRVAPGGFGEDPGGFAVLPVVDQLPHPLQRGLGGVLRPTAGVQRRREQREEAEQDAQPDGGRATVRVPIHPV